MEKRFRSVSYHLFKVEEYGFVLMSAEAQRGSVMASNSQRGEDKRRALAHISVITFTFCSAPPLQRRRSPSIVLKHTSVEINKAGPAFPVKPNRSNGEVGGRGTNASEPDLRLS
ncbi:Uncharacterized protein DAT39_010067, partial [Clarias magur]